MSGVREQDIASMKIEHILEDLIVLALGGAIGYFVSAHFDKKQSAERQPVDNQVADTLERIYGQAVRNGVKASVLLRTLEEKRNQYSQESDLVEIKSKLDHLAVMIAKANALDHQASPVAEVMEYKALGDRWSELVTSQLDLRVLDSDGRITVDRLLSTHKSLLPEGYAWAGVYRKQAVFVIETYGTSARIVDIALAENRVATIAPEAIAPNLARLFEHWNMHLPELRIASTDRKIDEIAHFHHEFQLIHPFMDGNGRLGRKLLEEQLSLLFDQKLTFRPKREEYLRGLRLLDMGESDAFKALLKAELSKFHVAL